MENKYENTTFYKIVCKDDNLRDIYVGHTTNFRQRVTDHKWCCNNPRSRAYNMPVYHFIRENGGNDNFQFVVIETKELNSKREAEEHETYLINILGASLNKCKPSRSKMQWRHDNNEKMQEYF